MQIGAANMENSMQFPQKIKNGIALSPSDSTSIVDIYLKKPKH